MSPRFMREVATSVLALVAIFLVANGWLLVGFAVLALATLVYLRIV